MEASKGGSGIIRYADGDASSTSMPSTVASASGRTAVSADDVASNAVVMCPSTSIATSVSVTSTTVTSISTSTTTTTTAATSSASTISCRASFPCILCCVAFETPLARVRHLVRQPQCLSIHLRTSIWASPCYCASVFCDSSATCHHMRLSAPCQRSPLTFVNCPTCQRTFRSPVDCVLHVRTSDCAKSYPCVGCKKGFVSVTARRQHLEDTPFCRSKNFMVPCNMYVCGICKLSFFSIISVYEHQCLGESTSIPSWTRNGVDVRSDIADSNTATGISATAANIIATTGFCFGALASDESNAPVFVPPPNNSNAVSSTASSTNDAVTATSTSNNAVAFSNTSEAAAASSTGNDDTTFSTAVNRSPANAVTSSSREDGLVSNAINFNCAATQATTTNADRIVANGSDSVVIISNNSVSHASISNANGIVASGSDSVVTISNNPVTHASITNGNEVVAHGYDTVVTKSNNLVTDDSIANTIGIVASGSDTDVTNSNIPVTENITNNANGIIASGSDTIDTIPNNAVTQAIVTSAEVIVASNPAIDVTNCMGLSGSRTFSIATNLTVPLSGVASTASASFSTAVTEGNVKSTVFTKATSFIGYNLYDRFLIIDKWHCFLCHHMFADRQQFRQHIKTSFPCRIAFFSQKESEFSCLSCKESFQTLVMRQNHLALEPNHQSVHQESFESQARRSQLPGQKISYCKVCCRAFLSPGSYHCVECLASFTKLKALQNHWNTRTRCRKHVKPIIAARYKSKAKVVAQGEGVCCSEKNTPDRKEGVLKMNQETQLQSVGIVHSNIKAQQVNTEMPQVKEIVPQVSVEAPGVDIESQLNVKVTQDGVETVQQKVKAAQANENVPQQHITEYRLYPEVPQVNVDVTQDPPLPPAHVTELQNVKAPQVNAEEQQLNIETLQQNFGVDQLNVKATNVCVESPTVNLKELQQNTKAELQNVITAQVSVESPTANVEEQQQNVKTTHQRIKAAQQNVEGCDKNIKSPQANDKTPQLNVAALQSDVRVSQSETCSIDIKFSCMSCKALFEHQSELCAHWDMNSMCKKALKRVSSASGLRGLDLESQRQLSSRVHLGTSSANLKRVRHRRSRANLKGVHQPRAQANLVDFSQHQSCVELQSEGQRRESASMEDLEFKES